MSSAANLQNGYAQARAAMVRFQLEARGVRDRRVLAVMADVPRHLFVPEALENFAYADRPLPIGFGQTISQPFVVARMLECLNLDGSERVLEIGTGSGYQTALLARLAREVYSIDIVAALAERATRVLSTLGVDNVTVVVGDGGQGYKQAQPYDAIIVAAACRQVPEELLAELAPGGRLVLPLGDSLRQRLLRIEKHSDGTTHASWHGDCAFVPLIGASATARAGFSRSSGPK